MSCAETWPDLRTHRHRHNRPLSFLVPPGLSAALPHRGDPDPGGRGETHHAEGQKPAPAPVGPAWLRVCPQHPGCDPPRARPALQQLQRPVPEQLGERLIEGGTWPQNCPKLIGAKGVGSATERVKNPRVKLNFRWESAVGTQGVSL